MTTQATPGRILNTAQAKALYNAMCELEGVGATIGHVVLESNVRMFTHPGGAVHVVEYAAPVRPRQPTPEESRRERYADPAAFALAYWAA